MDVDSHGPSVLQAKPTTTLDWDAVAAEIGGELTPSSAQTAIGGLTATLADWLAEEPQTQQEILETERDTDTDVRVVDNLEDPMDIDELASGTSRPRGVTIGGNPDWYPWPDRETCIFDIMCHLPRSLFSDNQMETILWCLSLLGIDNKPSLSTLKKVDELLQEHCGVESICYKGPLGHIYYANDLAAIISQELANPLIRKHLRFYPEDAGTHASQAWHGRQWLRELSPRIASPMIRIGAQDFYTYEPAKLADGRVIMPIRWFTKGGISGTQVFHGEVWMLCPVVTESGQRSYIVHEYKTIWFTAAELSLAFPTMIATFAASRLPDLQILIGEHLSQVTTRSS
ncbi:uncharacterized protein B0H18DRAFT_1114168 [Fomitopsis serialis]|uniref:uncharacterized protein n=1 Tax=Fomitopsis serialis TaxID=139415 RepID=UPI0020077243|nr:uncharacterized protein B0H18DRAFT_1114168 [Neoantrodia serialis]KAH9935419.1 hypothetical protein B0H18DRAFT_1114168 [Neoantrodia serialis]